MQILNFTTDLNTYKNNKTVILLQENYEVQSEMQGNFN